MKIFQKEKSCREKKIKKNDRWKEKNLTRIPKQLKNRISKGRDDF
jgi:hypothetical protein